MKRISLVAGFCFLISGVLFAQGFQPLKNPQTLVESLRKTSTTTQSIQAEFKEEKKLAALKEPQRTSGSFFYKRQDKMRWEQKLPNSYVILINADQMKIIDRGKEKKIAGGGMAGQIKGLLIGLVNGDFQDNKAFLKTYFENQNEFQIVLTPVAKRLKNVYTSMNLTFNKTTLRLKKISFFEKGGDQSEMEFFNEKINSPIADSIFDKL